MEQTTDRFYEFGPFRLHPLRRVLLRDGRQVALTAKVFDTLVIFVERRGRVLSKDELMAALWPDTAVEENNLTQHVSMLRKALGERAGAHLLPALRPLCGREVGHGRAGQGGAHDLEEAVGALGEVGRHVLHGPTGAGAGRLPAACVEVA